ncbi:MAG: type II toxin-antitoxin system HicA family toxin [Deltaproteobacteria bacterium]|nr:type II toxin-antitoxin system HicA family toxin [Deltaproteobacteria bacterium]
MHKIPRDITGNELCKLLGRFGYAVTRQTGSHIRLTAQQPAQVHHITIPDHDPIKIGTLNKILHDIAAFQKISKEQLVQQLWG